MDTRQSQGYKFKEIDKNLNFGFFHTTQHARHLLKLVDEMCKYEMDLASIVEDTEQTWFCPQTDGRMDGWTYSPRRSCANLMDSKGSGCTFSPHRKPCKLLTLPRRLPIGISGYPDQPVKIKLYLMSCQNVCSVPGDWTYAFIGPIHHRWLHSQVGVCKRAFLCRKRAHLGCGHAESEGLLFFDSCQNLTGRTCNSTWIKCVVVFWVKYVWTLVLYLSIHIESERHFCIYLYAFLIPYNLTPQERLVK